MLRTTREQVVAFRAAALHLVDRIPVDRIEDAARPCGLQNTPPGSAAVGAAARVEGLTREAWEDALTAEKSLVEVWAMRDSPFVVAASDLGIFTLGLRPTIERVALHRITSGLRPVVEKSGVSVLELVEQLGDRLRETLSAGPVRKEEVGRDLGSAVPRSLRQELTSEEKLPILTLTVARLLAHDGSFLIAPRSHAGVWLVRTDLWLGWDLPGPAPDEPRGELLRRFLHAFGPATAEDFAWWSTVQPDAASKQVLEEDARELWKLVEAEVDAVERPDGSVGYVLSADLPRLTSPPSLDGVLRLLPPHDPLLMLRDRETLVAEKHHRRLWRSMHNPGVVLADGRVVATWKARKNGTRLSVTVEPLESPVRPAQRQGIAEEAALIASLRDSASAEVTFA